MDKKEFNSQSFFLKGTNGIGLLLLHGWTCYVDEFLPLAKYLNSSGYTVYAPLLRGHGTKPEDLLGVTWQDWLSDAKDALAELKKNASKIFIGGISMGGNIAMLLSEDEAVAGIITMGASVKYRYHSVDKLVLAFMGFTKVYRKKYFPPWVRKQMGERHIYTYYPVESAKEVIKLAEKTRITLSQITKPILIMQSDSDHMVSNKSPQIMYEGVRSKIKDIFWIKDVYHVFVLERKVWEKIGAFIKNNQ